MFTEIKLEHVEQLLKKVSNSQIHNIIFFRKFPQTVGIYYVTWLCLLLLLFNHFVA